MANRRGHGEGSVTQRADGRWMVRVDLGRGADGKRRRKAAYAHTQADAVHKLKRLAGREVDGELLTTSTPTAARFLEDRFSTHREMWRPSTRQQTTEAPLMAFSHRHSGRFRLEQVTPQRVQRWLLLQRKRRTAHGAESPSRMPCYGRPCPVPNAYNWSRSMRPN